MTEDEEAGILVIDADAIIDCIRLLPFEILKHAIDFFAISFDEFVAGNKIRGIGSHRLDSPQG
jgi:hypothetical protein